MVYMRSKNLDLELSTLHYKYLAFLLFTSRILPHLRMQFYHRAIKTNTCPLSLHE